jgi:hypothetical protein
MSSIWDQVAKILKSGNVVSIAVPDSAEVIIGSRTVKGRPSIRDMNNPYLHYKTSKKGRPRPRCIVCKKPLHVNDVEVCSDACRERAEDWLRSKLSNITKSVDNSINV